MGWRSGPVCAGGRGHGEREAGGVGGGAEAGDEVEGEEGGVGGGGDDGVGPLPRRPVHAGEDAGERAGVAGDAVGQDRQAEGGEAGGVAVGVEREEVDLRARGAR